ncbi:MAG: helix-turn-helix domain-containing protein [bacterium]|nr:helix-turn-helix domain-containing protein [bacterium]
MITILISENEKKTKKIISEILSKEGYTGSDVLGQENVFKVVNREKINNLRSLKENIIEFDDSFLKENKGNLYKVVLEIIEKPLIAHVLKHSDGNQLKAARILGINRNTMRAKIKKYNIDPESYK